MEMRFTTNDVMSSGCGPGNPKAPESWAFPPRDTSLLSVVPVAGLIIAFPPDSYEFASSTITRVDGIDNRGMLLTSTDSRAPVTSLLPSGRDAALPGEIRLRTAKRR